MSEFRDLFSAFQAKSFELTSKVRQCDLLTESSFLRWSKEIGVKAFGVVNGDVGEFWKRGWLRCEEIKHAPKDFRQRMDAKTIHYKSDDRAFGESWTLKDESIRCEPLFHPFRIFALQEIIHDMSLTWAPSSLLSPSFATSYSRNIIEHQSMLDKGIFYEKWSRANCLCDIAIALEPVYWPWITSVFRGQNLVNDLDVDKSHEEYRKITLEFLSALSLDDLKNWHEELRFLAARFDDNSDLYRLLRSANWNARKRLKGHLALALWLRHMAEVLRRGVEEVFEIQLKEEDIAYGMWRDGAREKYFGSARALDHPTFYRKELLHEMGLDISIHVSWYVEGQTEVGFLQAALGEVRDNQIEVINCKGRFAGSALTDLFEALQRDIFAERFSFMSVDFDVASNIEAVKRIIRQDLIVGYVSVNDPDFEFANFTLDELVSAAIFYDSVDRFPIDSSGILRVNDFTGVTNGRQFQECYMALHQNQRNPIKGVKWGEALWEIVKDRPNWNDGVKRPIFKALDSAYRSKKVIHKFQRNGYQLDPDTFSIKERV